MKTVGLRIRLEPELRRAFVEACREADLSAAHVLRLFMRDYVDQSIAGKQRSLFEHSESVSLDDQNSRA